MPQAYPPSSSKAKQQVQNSNPAQNQVRELKPILSKESLELPASSAPALLPASPNPRYVDPAVSFRQQTFDKGFFVKAGEENPYDHLNSKYSESSQKPTSQELHQRSIALQDRIGNLEQMLKARIAEQSQESIDDEENYQQVKEEPHIIASESLTSFEKSEKAHSHSQS